MIVEQLYTGCLAEAAYYIESEGEAAIIDPLRETDPYIKRAARNGAKIKYIFETHFHADFVSGHIDLAAKTGATIVYGPTAETGFESHVAQDNEEFKIGKATIKLLHTPGHTLESSTYLLKDENGKDYAIFTGDTLFIGDVGRPDLAVKSHLTKEDLAGKLYESLQHKIIPLSDEILVYPAHGAGSACGKSMSKETFDTLGHQKKVNYALNAKNKEDFIQKVTEGIFPPPAYFPLNAQLNKQGYESFDVVKTEGLTPFSAEEVENMVANYGALLLDTRSAVAFSKGYIPGAINIGLEGQFAPWVGTLIPDLHHPIVFIADIGKEEEVVTRLARVGFDRVLGYLKGGFEVWKNAGKPVDILPSISASNLEKRMQKPLHILDIRRPSEYDEEHVVGAENYPLDTINEWIAGLDKKEEYYVHCAGGYRSMITASILKSRGFEHISDIAGGYGAIAKTGIAKSSSLINATKN